MLHTGLYEQLISTRLSTELSAFTDRIIKSEAVDNEEAPRILAKYLTEVLEKALSNVRDKGGNIEDQVSIANRLIAYLSGEASEETIKQLTIDNKAELLLALFDKENSIFALNDKAEIVRPITSLAGSSLFTGAVHEPSMHSELKREILSGDRIDMLVSFIKWSGLRLLIEELKTKYIKKTNKLIVG